MGLFKKKPDPISDRSKALKAQIASLDAQIQKLNAQVRQTSAQPRLRSTALPHGQTASPPPNHAAASEPIFEPVDHRRLQSTPEDDPPAEHYNDLGLRKYDLVAVWRWLRNHFRGPPANSSRLVTYLAAGSIKGLRPLRYEKRVARNRFIALVLLLVALLWVISEIFFRGR